MSAELATVEQPRVYRDYSPEFKAEVLAALKSNNGNVYGTAKEYGIDESVLRRWIKQADRYRHLSDVKSIELAAKCEYNAHQLADSIADHDLDNAPLNHKAVALGIMTEKMLLLRGQPTSITAVISSDDLRQAQLTVQAITAQEQIPLYDAAIRLAAELDDVPELASQLRAWAEAELKGK